MPNLRFIAIVCFLLANILETHGNACPEEIHQKLDRILQLLEKQEKEAGHCKEVVTANEDNKIKDLVCFTDEKLENIVAKTELTKKDIRILVENGLTDTQASFEDLFNDFIFKYPKGKVTWKDFADGLTRKLGNETMEKLGEHLLRIFDWDRDCSSDFTEFIVTHHIFNFGSAEEVFARIFPAFDMDADDIVSYQEMERILKAMSGPINDWFGKTVDDEYVKQAYAQMVKNHHRYVSREEFLKPITKKDYFRSIFIDLIFKMLVSGPNAGPRGSQLGLLAW